MCQTPQANTRSLATSSRPGTKSCVFPKCGLVMLIEAGLIVDALICSYRMGESRHEQKKTAARSVSRYVADVG